MRYYQPMKRTTDGQWDFVVRYNEHIWAIGYCAGWHEPTEELLTTVPILGPHIEKMRKYKDKFHELGHSLAHQAAACYRDYLLDSSLRLYAPSAAGPQNCMMCGRPTELSARVEPRYAYIPLCEEHMRREMVEKIFDPASFILA